MNGMKQYLILSAIGLLLTGSPLSLAAQDGIVIRNDGKFVPTQPTNVDAGPTDPSAQVNTGNILNNHYYPGLNLYSRANYKYAKEEMDYVIARPQYIEKNPNQGQILSVAYFIRGSVYFRHASGLGRLALAKSDFEQALKWNPQNHLARLELARLVATLDQQAEAISMLTDLLKGQLTANLRQEAENDLQSLKSGKFKAVTTE
jgi:tetratricopeptide repeat protein